MEAYSFWCSTCKKDHAGECPPRGDVYESVRLKLWPSVGSVWDVVAVPGSPQAKNHRGGEKFTVQAQDIQLGVVIGVSSLDPQRILHVEIAAWHEQEGGRCIEAPTDWFWYLRRPNSP